MGLVYSKIISYISGMKKENLPILGKILTGVSVSDDEIYFTCSDGTKYIMYHEQDCCESVRVDDISGDLTDLFNEPLLVAEIVSNDEFIQEYEESLTDRDRDIRESQTWTFYRFATINGYVDIRWLGESNGYYSESVTFIEDTKENN